MVKNSERIIPQVKFKSHRVKDEIGKWLNQRNIPVNNIEISFGLLLKVVGIDPIETCIISSDGDSYQCHLKKVNEDSIITLYDSDNEDYAQFIIKYQKQNFHKK